MPNIKPGRLTVQGDEPLVVFLIGARVNKWWLLPFSLPILSRMDTMLRELLGNPDSGLLGVQRFGTLSVQYWKSVEHLQRYANDPQLQHQPAAQSFWKKLFKNRAIGIWHETFVVREGHYESLYVNMPPIGLGRIQPLVPAKGRLRHLSGRLNQDAECRRKDPAQLSSVSWTQNPSPFRPTAR